jgi:hypothetical protein
MEYVSGFMEKSIKRILPKLRIARRVCSVTQMLKQYNISGRKTMAIN